MASRRTNPKKAAGKRGKGLPRAELEKLLKKAETEVQKLLKGDEAGTLTRLSLKAGLEEVEGYLVEMEPLERDW